MAGEICHTSLDPKKFGMSHTIIQIDETISLDSWSHVTRGDGLNKMVQ